MADRPHSVANDHAQGFALGVVVGDGPPLPAPVALRSMRPELSMPDDNSPWDWLAPSQAEAWTPLPPADPGAPPTRARVVGALMQAANEQTGLLLLVGWSEDALDLIAADRVLANKDIVWVVRPGQLAPLADALRRRAERPRLRVGAYAHSADLALLMHHLPIFCHSLAVLDAEPDLGRNLQHLRQLRISSVYLRVERTLTDLGNLIARGDRLGDSIPLSYWKGRAQGRAALCLAAGPSLDRHLDFVRQHQDRCVVIAVDILSRRLSEAGVRVDVVCNVDSHDLVADRLTAPADPRTLLVMPLGGHLAIDQRFPRISYEAGDAIGDRVLGRGGFYARGTNVGCATVGFAAHLGCSEAVLIGHDLSYARGSYYSALTADPDAITAFNFASVPEGGYAVPGNDGTTVMTSWDFKLGIRDLGLLLEHARSQGLTAYNANAGLGIGALIANTAPVPPGWTPPGDGPALPSAEPPRLGADANLGSGFAADVRAQAQSYRVGWERSCETEPLETFLALMSEPTLAMGAGLYLPCIAGHIANLFRLAAMSTEVTTAPQRTATAASLRAALGHAEQLILTTIDSGRAPTCSEASEWPEAQGKAFFDALRQRIPVLTAGTLDEVLLPTIGPDWRSLRQAVPAAELPPPLSWLDGLHLAAAMHVGTPRAWLFGALAHCRLDPLRRVDYALALALEHGVCDPAVFEPGCADAHPDPAVRAVRAVLRLEQGAPSLTDARDAAAWPGAWNRLADALTDPAKTGGGEVLATLVRERALVPDDALAARILARHSDVLGCCALLAPFESAFSECTTMAIAMRLMDIRDHTGALKHLERIRPLSRHHEAAMARRLVCLVALNRIDAIDGVLAEAATLAGAIRALHSFLVDQFGPARALANLAAYRLLPIPANVLSDSLGLCLTKRTTDCASWAELVRDLAQVSADAADDDPDEQRALRELVPVAERTRVLLAGG